MSEHHRIDYIEFVVTDMEAARRFYADAFDWTFNDYGPTYSGIRDPGGAEGDEVGGLRLDEAPPARGGPLVLLYSEDLDATVEAVRAAGGSILQEPYAFPGGRRFHFADPSGNELGAWGS